jgi:hypothetical protein
MNAEIVPACIRCGYNLSALLGNNCPECGWPIDWRLARLRGDDWRCGTPAHRAHGWRIIDQTLLTLLVMLVLPWRFARQIRPDESIWPSLSIAALSFAVTFAQDAVAGEWPGLAVIGAGAAAVMLCQVLAFSALDFRSGPRRVRWAQRVRLWLLVSLYSTCFVGTWRFTNGPPLVVSLTDVNFYWPPAGLSRWTADECGVTIIFYWWWAILGTALIVRNRPRWLAVLTAGLVFLFSWVGYQVGYWAYERLF